MSNIREFLNSCIDEKIFPGATYIFGTSEKVLESGSIGNLGIDRGPVNLNTLYDMASVTKPIVTLAFMKQFEEGKVCLDDTIDRFLQDYVGHEKAKITMFQLLTHTSVIPGQVPLYKTCHTRQQMLDGIREIPARDNVTTPVMYSSQGMIVIGEVIATIAGKPLDAVMQEKVFDKTGMRHTMFNPPRELHSNIASTEDCPWRGKVVIGQVHDENAVVLGGVCAHAGLFSNVEDMAKLGVAMLTGKDAKGHTFLQRSTIELMTKNHTKGLNLARSLGWQAKDAHDSPAGDLFSDKSYGHTGFTGTSLWVDPTRDLYAVLLTNRVHPSREGEGIKRVRQIFHNLVVMEWERKK